MVGSASDPLWRFLSAQWLRHSQHSWRRLPVAHDSPHVHAPGTNPDRILIAGDGASAGVGVLTHDLGLPGYLARGLSGLTGHATDVDIMVRTDMTVSKCFEAIAGLRLSRYDVILLSLGVNESLDFLSPARWEADLGRLLEQIADASPASTRTVVLSIPHLSARTRFPAILRRRVDRRARMLNEVTGALARRSETVEFVHFAVGEDIEADGAHAYHRWATGIAPSLSRLLSAHAARGPRTEVEDERGRHAALLSLGILELPPDKVLDEIATTARDLLGVPLAAVTLIDGDRQTMASAIGMAAQETDRRDAFCDITIRRADRFVIEDTLLDSRYSDNPLVVGPPHIRFYAGYPIETPDGYRVGALCVMDTVPRALSARDASLLRDLAQRAQRRLWVLGGETGSPGPAA